MNLLLQWFIIFINLCAANETLHVVSKKGYKEQCFPVRLNKGTEGHLNIYYDDYVPVNVFSFDQSVSVAIYRHFDLEKNDFTHNGKTLRVCDFNAMNYGYCEQKHMGKILFKYVDSQKSKRKLVNLILNDINSFLKVFKFEETGYYCVGVYSSSVKSYKLTLEIIDGYEETLKERNDKFISSLLLAVSLLTKGSLIGAWIFWSNFNVFKLPFQTKIVLIDGFFSIIKHTINFYETHEPHKLFTTELYQEQKSFLFDIVYPLFFSFYLYQFAISFAYKNPQTNYGILHYVSVLFISIGRCFVAPQDLLHQVFLKGYSLEIVLNFTIRFSKGLLGFKIFNEVLRTVEDYNDVNRGHEPKVKLFKVWILSELFNLALEAYGDVGISFLFNELLKEVSSLRELLFIDDSNFRIYENFDITITKNVIQALLYSIVSFRYLTPSYYEGVLKFHHIKKSD